MALPELQDQSERDAGEVHRVRRPADGRSRTAAARAARTHAKHTRWAAELRLAGWAVKEPQA